MDKKTSRKLAYLKSITGSEVRAEQDYFVFQLADSNKNALLNLLHKEGILDTGNLTGVTMRQNGHTHEYWDEDERIYGGLGVRIIPGAKHTEFIADGTYSFELRRANPDCDKPMDILFDEKSGALKIKSWSIIVDGAIRDYEKNFFKLAKDEKSAETLRESFNSLARLNSEKPDPLNEDAVKQYRKDHKAACANVNKQIKNSGIADIMDSTMISQCVSKFTARKFEFK
jgi:hypothetical protein